MTTSIMHARASFERWVRDATRRANRRGPPTYFEHNRGSLETDFVAPDFDPPTVNVAGGIVVQETRPCDVTNYTGDRCRLWAGHDGDHCV